MIFDDLPIFVYCMDMMEKRVADDGAFCPFPRKGKN